MSRNDTEEIVAKWLQVCPPCDAGIGAPCTHPDEDYRPVILMLLNQRDGARTALGAAIDENRRLKDQLRHADYALAGQRAQLARIRELHTDSPASVCPSCARLNDVSDTDDGLVAWPCPTILAIDPGVAG